MLSQKQQQQQQQQNQERVKPECTDISGPRPTSFESAKLCDPRAKHVLGCQYAWLAYVLNVPCVVTCSRANVPCVLTCLRAHVPICLACLRAHLLMYLLTCLSANVSVYVLTCQCVLVLRCSRANVPCVLTCSRVNVPSSITWIHI